MHPETIIQARIAQAKRGPTPTPFDAMIPGLVVLAIGTDALVPGLALLNVAAPLVGLYAALFFADEAPRPAIPV